MGKKSRRTNGDGQPNIAKAVDRAFRRLALPDGRTFLGWRTDAARKCGEEEIDEFEAVFDRSTTESDGTNELARWAALDFDRARYLYAGWYSAALLEQVRWLAPELGTRLAGQPAPLLVEVGSGLGVAAAVLGAALRVPVLAVDPMPGSAECVRRFAELTGAEVEAHEASVESLAEILRGRPPTALYGIGVLRHLQRHVHAERAVFSDAGAINAARESAIAIPALSALLGATSGADVLALEVTCSDWLGELTAAASQHGYNLSIPKPGRISMVVTDDVTPMATLALSQAGPRLGALDLLEGYAGYPPTDGPVRGKEGAAAETWRARQAGVQLLAAAEVVFDEGVLRIEAAGSSGRWWCYQASTLGARSLLPVGSGAKAKALLAETVAQYAAMGRQTRTVVTSASMWS